MSVPKEEEAMSARAQPQATTKSSAVESPYAAAERAWWAKHGIEPRERFVEVEEPRSRLRVLEVGDGDPILFIHGTAGSAPVWAPLVARLQGYRCIMIDRPGWAPSSAIDFSVSGYKDLVTRLLGAVMDSLGLQRAHLAGASIGDLWTLRFAQARPHRVDRIILMGGGPLFSENEVPKIIRVLASPLGAVMARLPEKRGQLKSISRSNGHGASLEAGRMEDFLDWREALGRHMHPMRHEREMVRAIVDWRKNSFRSDLRLTDSELNAITNPTLMIYGSEDPAGSVEVWKRFTESFADAGLVVLDGHGHVPWLDDPERVAVEVRRFVAGQR
jgi:2-hydroxy-6-oxonona-2,4-dienedioate hydrolase